MMRRELLKISNLSRRIVLRKCILNRKQCSRSISFYAATFSPKELKPPDKVGLRRDIRYYCNVPQNYKASSALTAMDTNKSQNTLISQWQINRNILQRYLSDTSSLVTKITKENMEIKNKNKLQMLPSMKAVPAMDAIVPKRSTNRGKSVHDKENQFNKLSDEELVEKFITSISSDIHLKNRVYKNDVQRVLAKIKAANFSTKRQQLLMLRCCTELLADESPMTRMTLVEEIWKTLKCHAKFTVDHYNELLKVYLANKRKVTAVAFLSNMSQDGIVPDSNTYELLLAVIGESGDLNQATEIISNMKAMNMPATENVFHSLIVCQGKAGNIENIQEILTMMTSLKLEHTADTYVAVCRALAFCKMRDELLAQIELAYKNGIMFEERHIMEIVKTMASYGLYECIPKVLQYLPEKTLNTPSISPYMQSVATQLVFQNQAIVALQLYKCLPLPSFGPKDDQALHGRSLVRDCVKAAVPASVIGLVAQELMASGRNPIALNNAAEAALQLGKTPLVLDLFVRMKQLGMPLRPHYFWPILISNARIYGEKGIMSTLKTMVSMDVTPDYHTLIDYCIPHVSFTSPQNLMKKFMDAGLTSTTALTPMMETLLNTGQVRAAKELCELFHGKIEGEKLIGPLLKGYHISLDLKSTIQILQYIRNKSIDKNKDYTGRFLCTYLQSKKGGADMQDFLSILRAIRNTSLRLSPAIVDICLNQIPSTISQKLQGDIQELLLLITDDRMVDDSEFFAHQMPNPKQMDEPALRAHLIELEAKGMNTRGVLRKLLQMYCRNNNLAEAKSIAEKCVKEGVFLSAGMKASIFDLYVKLGDLEKAEKALADLNSSAPNFLIDEYKIIDFATLMVQKRQLDRAVTFINDQSKKRNIVGGRNISMNCWRLLDAVASNGNYDDVRGIFDLLVKLGYCKPTNVILGPLVKVLLKQNKLEEAVTEFTRIATVYNHTPLKHELLCKIFTTIFKDVYCEDNIFGSEKVNNRLMKLARNVLTVNKNIHGASDEHLTLVAALADVGFKKTLRQTLLDPNHKIHPDALQRRCQRFADEKKVHALENLAECARDLRHIDISEIYDMILDVHQRHDESEKAVELFNRMQVNDIIPSERFIRNLYNMLKTNNKKIPNELTLLVNKQDIEEQALNNN